MDDPSVTWDKTVIAKLLAAYVKDYYIDIVRNLQCCIVVLEFIVIIITLLSYTGLVFYLCKIGLD